MKETATLIATRRVSVTSSVALTPACWRPRTQHRPNRRAFRKTWSSKTRRSLSVMRHYKKLSTTSSNQAKSLMIPHQIRFPHDHDKAGFFPMHRISVMKLPKSCYPRDQQRSNHCCLLRMHRSNGTAASWPWWRTQWEVLCHEKYGVRPEDQIVCLCIVPSPQRDLETTSMCFSNSHAYLLRKIVAVLSCSLRPHQRAYSGISYGAHNSPLQDTAMITGTVMRASRDHHRSQSRDSYCYTRSSILPGLFMPWRCISLRRFNLMPSPLTTCLDSQMK